jgi:hypothetical protein
MTFHPTTANIHEWRNLVDLKERLMDRLQWVILGAPQVAFRERIFSHQRCGLG